MKVEKQNRVKIKITGKDVSTLKSALDKIISESKLVGFRRSVLEDNEISVINKLFDALK